MDVSLLALAAALQAAHEKPAAPPQPAPPPVSGWRAPPPPPPPRHSSQGSRARANLASYVSNDDYPMEALLNHEEGNVRFLLNVGTDGRVTRCTILESSRSASLDEATCRIMASRARFSPALGVAGRPVEDRVVARIAWRLQGPPGPLCPPDVSDCTQLPFPVAMYRTRPLAPLASLVSQAEFAAHARSAGEAPITRFRLSVGPDGRVTECELLMTSGSAVLDEAACLAMRERARFTPGHDADGHPASDSYWGHIRWSGLDESPGPVPTTI